MVAKPRRPRSFLLGEVIVTRLPNASPGSIGRSADGRAATAEPIFFRVTAYQARCAEIELDAVLKKAARY